MKSHTKNNSCKSKSHASGVKLLNVNKNVYERIIELSNLVVVSNIALNFRAEMFQIQAYENLWRYAFFEFTKNTSGQNYEE